ncbi:MAG: hypothetical protein ABL970_08950 [Nitrospira sp.]
MPKPSLNKRERKSLEWVVRLCYGLPVRDLLPDQQAAQLKKFYEFCTPEVPRRGKFLTAIFRYVAPDRKQPPLLPTIEQLERFQSEEKQMLEEKFQGEEVGREHCTAALGASCNISPGIVSFTSGDPVYTAMTTSAMLLANHWGYVRRCPRWSYKNETCDRVFVLKKSKGMYCSNRCRMRVANRKEDRIPQVRYGVAGPRPKKKGGKNGTKR